MENGLAIGFHGNCETCISKKVCKYLDNWENKKQTFEKHCEHFKPIIPFSVLLFLADYLRKAEECEE